ncbi:interferon-induced, double-stranded RNA-activated protein kinase-like [Brachionichthys hirsutus]|uniref:interferon-induced, double-stranded RNA-activated protein kinase-like n=1 Tax=Brachionichthys hirsutus TaxID=412623 RepID=UPI00360513AF
METKNYVALLNERKLSTKSDLRYEDVEAVGPAHSKTFTIRAVLNGKAYPEGVGKNKKEARQAAAENVLKTLTGSVTEVPTTPVQKPSATQDNCISWLNEYGHRKGVKITPVESARLDQNYIIQCCYFVVGDKEYPPATGKTKKKAKEEAARLAYAQIQTDKQKSMASSQTVDELNVSASDMSGKTTMSSTPTDGGFRDFNFIGLINNYCQEKNLTGTYVPVKRCAPAHASLFSYKLVIDGKDYPVGEGRNCKKAKQSAAQLAWSALQEQPDWDSKLSFGSAESDVAPTSLLTPSTLMDCEQSPDAPPETASDLVVSTDSPKNQEPDNFKAPISGRSDGEEKTATAVSSRFTSEYDSIERLGSGAFGRVFKARQILVEKYFAVKIVRSKEKSLREVTALAELHHCNIIRYFTCWLEDSGYQWESSASSSGSSQSASDSSIKFLYIQMELCDSRTLRLLIDENNQNVKKLLKDSKRKEESLKIFKQIVSGVEYVHSKKFIHRDLKPANIMFGKDGNAKIGDFGLVTVESGDAENLLERTVYKGTPSYMSPEQKSSTNYDRPVDVFALGLIFFELLWPIPTIHERNAIWNDVRNQKPPPDFLLNFPLESKMIKSTLHAKPGDRPEASQLKKDLEAYMETLGKKSCERLTGGTKRVDLNG